MSESKLATTVRNYYAAYESVDRRAITFLLSHNLRFSSPLDDHIDLETYLSKCWAFSSERPHFEIESLLERDNVVSVKYLCSSSTRPSFQNTEIFRFEDGKIVEIEVYFGRSGKVAMENTERSIRRLIDDWLDAVRARDAERAAKHVSEDVVVFDVVNPLRTVGKAALVARAQEWFNTFDGNIGFEIREVKIAAGEDTAYHSGLNHVDGKTKHSGRLEMWWRSTVGYRKVGGRWWIVHEHNSVPFDPATGSASLTLQP
jgi:uncharacterized protein (TIGR02246 family)